jgi:rhodanese-related sulfurtransferase
MNRISLDDLASKIQNGNDFVLLEALPPRYFEQKHLPGAKNMPHDAVEQLAPALIGDRAREIVIYCSGPTCQNSTIAARRLETLGYENVRVFEGGKATWEDAGLPLESSPSAAAAP